jgi:hypothetical protein
MTPGTKSGCGAEKDKHSAENDKNSAENDEIKVPKKSAETGGNHENPQNSNHSESRRMERDPVQQQSVEADPSCTKMNIIRPTVPKKGGASRGVSADDVQAGSTLNPQQIPPNLHQDVDDSRAGCQVYKSANLTELIPFSDHRVLQGVGGRTKKPPFPIGSRQSTIFPRYEQVPELFLDSIRDREGALSTAKRRAGDVAVVKPAKSVSPKLDLATPRGG